MASHDKLTHPNCDGWWLWFESGRDVGERILVSGGGAFVADDEEWEAATGRPPSEVSCENYWEGTEITQAMMPGLWQKLD